MAKKQLDKGIAAYRRACPSSNDTFSVDWLPFYLNPGVMQTSINKKTYYYRKYGEAQAEGIFARLRSVGAENGIKFTFGGNTGNTRNSHRLIHFAKTKSPEVMDKVVNNLFAAYFEKEQDITSLEVLKRAGVEAGINEEEVQQLLSSDEGGKEVDREVRDAQRQHIMAVPHIVLQGRYKIGSVEDSDAFITVLHSINESERAKE